MVQSGVLYIFDRQTLQASG